MITEKDSEVANAVLTSSISMKEIGEKYGMSASAVTKMLKDNFGITRKNRFFYRAELARREYSTSNNRTLKEIVASYDISMTAYKRYLRHIDENEPAQKNTYHVNMHFFDKIDTEEKAYWLGFLMADGHNTGSKIELALQSKDVNHIRKYRMSLSSNHRIYYSKSDDTARITISDKNITEKLDKKGVISNKTYFGHIAKYAALPRYYARHYIRGYFDGNGSMSKLIYQDLTSINSLTRKMKKVAISIHTITFATEMRDLIKSMTGLTPSIYQKPDKSACEVYLEGEDNVRRFLDFIYKDSKIYLDRKYFLYLRYILPSDLEIDRIISEKLSANTLPKFDYDAI